MTERTPLLGAVATCLEAARAAALAAMRRGSPAEQAFASTILARLELLPAVPDAQAITDADEARAETLARRHAEWAHAVSGAPALHHEPTIVREGSGA